MNNVKTIYYNIINDVQNFLCKLNKLKLSIKIIKNSIKSVRPILYDIIKY